MFFFYSKYILSILHLQENLDHVTISSTSGGPQSLGNVAVMIRPWNLYLEVGTRKWNQPTPPSIAMSNCASKRILIYAFRRINRLINGSRRNLVLERDVGVNAALIVEAHVVEAKETNTSARVCKWSQFFMYHLAIAFPTSWLQAMKGVFTGSWILRPSTINMFYAPARFPYVSSHVRTEAHFTYLSSRNSIGSGLPEPNIVDLVASGQLLSTLDGGRVWHPDWQNDASRPCVEKIHVIWRVEDDVELTWG